MEPWAKACTNRSPWGHWALTLPGKRANSSAALAAMNVELASSMENRWSN
jgi:hypothetical protein